MRDSLRAILEEVRSGDLDVDTAMQQLAPTTDLGFASVDQDREARCGFPEVVYCEGKTPGQAAAIATAILGRSARVLLTRATPDHAAAVQKEQPQADFDPASGTIVIDPTPLPKSGHIAIVAAGTSDLGVATEARVTANILGARTTTHTDVGVAGLHRLLAQIPEIRSARVVVAVAGMEGALASVVGGLVDRPVVAVPTSVGYGVHFGGITPLLAMLSSCAAGVGVVNVDNGFGAGYLAALINRVSDPTPLSPEGPHP